VFERFRGRLAFVLTLLAALYSLALVVWFVAVWAPPGDTLLGLAIFVQPLIVSLLMWALLRRRCTTGGSGVSSVAFVLAPLYLVWSVVAGFTLSAGALPAALLLAGAAAAAPRGPARPLRRVGQWTT
jgi:hypothetical protein